MSWGKLSRKEMVTSIIHLIPINETDRRLRPLSSDLVLTTSSEGVQEQGPQTWKLPLSVFYLREGGPQQMCNAEENESSLPPAPLEPLQPVFKGCLQILEPNSFGAEKTDAGRVRDVSISIVVLRFSKL